MNLQPFIQRIRTPLQARWRQPEVQLGVIAVTVFTAVGVGLLLALAMTNSKQGVYQAALLPVGFAGCVILVLVSSRSMSWGPLFILVAALFLPFYVGTGSQSVIVDSLLLTMAFAAYWTTRLLLTRRFSQVFELEINRPILGFALAAVISLGIGILFRDPHVYVWDDFPLVQLGATAVFVMLPFAFMLVANEVRDLRVLKWMVALTLLAAVLGFLTNQTDLELPVNTAGNLSMWFIALSVSLAAFHKGLPALLRLALFGIAGAWVYYGLGLNISWVAGWLPGIVALGVLAFLRSWRTLILFLLIVLIVLGHNQDFFVTDFIQTEADESLYTRIDAFEVNWEITKEHLLFGTGPGGYAIYYMTYFPNRAMATHNNMVDILSQMGLVGMAMFGWLIFELTRAGFRVNRKFRGSGTFQESLANAALAGTFGAVAIMFFGDWVLPFVYTQTIAGYDYIVPTWLFMGTIIALDRLPPPETRN